MSGVYVRPGTKYGTPRGESKTRLYKLWCGMIDRCENPKASSFDNYGKRGISVCDEWHNFGVFREWAMTNGYADGFTIDRVDNDDGYSPENCRWATWKEQANNRRSNRKIEYNGETKNISEWAEFFGIDLKRFNSAIQRGRSIEQILSWENRGKPYRIELTHNGETHTLLEWSKIIGISKHTLDMRLRKYGWSVDRALTTPVKRRTS